MKILSLNTWMGIISQPLMEFFAAHQDADVLCLQEVYKDAEGKVKPNAEHDVDFNLFGNVSALLADTHVGYFEPTVSDYYGIATFVKKNLLVTDCGGAAIYTNPTLEQDIERDPGNHNRRLQFAQIEHNGAPLLVVNVHGMYKSGSAHLDIPERVEQTRLIREFLSARNQPFVMVGDFNLDLQTESLAALDAGYRNLIKEYGVTSTRTHFYPRQDLYADYAILSPDVSVVDFKVLPDVVSDHAALYLEIS